LTCRFVCVSCNSRMGRLIEGHAKADPTIQLLASNLARKIPQLAAKLSEGQKYVSVGPGGKSLGKVKEGEFVVHSRKLDDGSLIQPTPIAAQSIQRMLERANYSKNIISDALRRLELAPENTRVTLPDGLAAVKWSIEQIHPALDGPLLNPVVPLKSAYEFLALHLNTTVYEDAPALAAIRSALAGAPLDPAHLIVERLHAPKMNPFHGLVFEGNTPYAKVQVRLFGQLAFRVHFKTLAVGGPRFIYTHDLEANTEHVAQSSSGDEQG